MELEEEEAAAPPGMRKADPEVTPPQAVRATVTPRPGASKDKDNGEDFTIVDYLDTRDNTQHRQVRTQSIALTVSSFKLLIESRTQMGATQRNHWHVTLCPFF